jgi:hypothetical protein
MVMVAFAASTIALSIVTTSMVNAQNTTNTWISSFALENCIFASNGANKYFILEPRYQLTLENQKGQDTKPSHLVITVLNETKIVNGTETRVLEERETEDGEVVEISRNYFAVCKPTNDILYFGEEVDDYEAGKTVNHEGDMASWGLITLRLE